jgi:hypothetical protein
MTPATPEPPADTRSSAARVTVAVITSPRRERDSRATLGNLDVAAHRLDPGQPSPEAGGVRFRSVSRRPDSETPRAYQVSGIDPREGGHSQSKAPGRPAEGPPGRARGRAVPTDSPSGRCDHGGGNRPDSGRSCGIDRTDSLRPYRLRPAQSRPCRIARHPDGRSIDPASHCVLRAGSGPRRGSPAP